MLEYVEVVVDEVVGYEGGMVEGEVVEVRLLVFDLVLEVVVELPRVVTTTTVVVCGSSGLTTEIVSVTVGAVSGLVMVLITVIVGVDVFLGPPPTFTTEYVGVARGWIAVFTGPSPRD